jgi:UDP-glucose 4-epimerase
LPIDEIHPLNPFNPYADSKIKGEELCRSYHNFFGLNTVVVRPFNIYGHGQNNNFLLPSIIEQSKKGVVTLKDSRPKRDFVHIDDIVEALKLCVVKELIGLEIFNLGSGISYSVKEVVEMVNLQFSDTLKINYTKEHRSNEVLDTVANINHAQSLLGWKPRITLEEGIKRTIHGE